MVQHGIRPDKTPLGLCFNLQVVNDCAERAIKLVEDFSCTTKDEEQFQFVIQCVEDRRKNFSSLTQSSLLNL